MSVASPDAAIALSRREATLRSAATTCLAGIALVEAIELPSLLVRSAGLAALCLAAIALCTGGGLALATAASSASPKVWRAVAATAALVLAGWALPHAVALPETAGARGDWGAMPGLVCAGAAIACLLLAAAAARRRRATARGLATALAALVVAGPGVVALLVAAGPSPPGGEAAIAVDVHVHAHSFAPERDILFRPGPTGNHYVTRVSTPSRPATAGVALVVAAAFVFVCGAVGSLRRRSVPSRATAEHGMAGTPA
jgi:hypothetical protein